MPLIRLLLALCITMSWTVATAHEVWLEPERWEMSKDQDISARLINGQNFKGIELSWNPRAILRAEKWVGELGYRLTGRIGDVPAITTTPISDGLLTLAYQSRPGTVTYNTLEDFAEFLTEKGQESILSAHAARNPPDAPIKEAFSRYVKTLIAVGPGKGADIARGLEIEIVALTNPYTTAPGTELRFQALYQNAPLADNRVTIFVRAPNGSISSSHARTDPQGIVEFASLPGHTYLVDTVVLRQPSREVTQQIQGAVWESLWASLTFRVPDAQ